MNDFSFTTTPKIIVEANGAQNIGTHCKDLLGPHTLIVTDHDMVRLRIIEPLLDGLQAAGIETTVFEGVVPEPPAKVVREAADQARLLNVTSVIGFGGGSAMDVAKLVALLTQSPQSLEKIYGVGLVIGERLPLLLVPTTAGTGSEVTPVAVVTSDEDIKSPVVAPQLLPDVAFLDGALTTSLPTHITAATGVDAMVHALEAFTSKIRKNALSDILAKEALVQLSTNIVTVTENGTNVEARAKMLYGSMLAGQAFANASVGAVHALAYPLGGRFHVSHGLSNSLVLPHVMKANLPEAASLYAEVARVVLPDDTFKSDLQAAEACIDYFLKLPGQLGLQDKLGEMGITAEDVPDLVQDGLGQERLLSYNIKNLTAKDIEQIYQDAL